jgi:ankyrin repeat protein
VNGVFIDIYGKLVPILQNDSVWCFLRLLKDCSNKGMTWTFSITSETLTFMVNSNSLRCVKVVLEGKTPKLCGMHANPNCINSYGYFPIHKAADKFFCDMIKLLLRHGAPFDLHTVGNDVIENLLPLHVIVLNTCMHKYLEDNLSISVI